eukprot:scaffold4176_cov109-Skeletonema_dohrnii-CCMP3373.AAC.1
MADNNNNTNTSEELPLDGGGDIEQGGSTIIPEKNDSVWSLEAAAITPPQPSKWTLGGLEEVEEDAAPVPLIQHIAGMGIEKDDIRASESASLPRPPTAQDVRPTVMEDDSQRPKPSEYVTVESNADDEFNRRLLAKAAMAADLKGETKRPTVMEEEDSSRPTSSSDSAVFESNVNDEFNRRILAKSAMAAASKGEDKRPPAPVIDDDSQSRPFGSTNFEDEGSKKITAAPQPQPPLLHAMKQFEDGDGDDAAPRPFNSAELVSSCSNGQTEAAGGVAASSIYDNGSIGEDPVVQQMNEDPSPGDEENNLQRLVGSPDIHFTSDDEKTRQIVPSAAETETETHPSLPILEAYLVEEEGGSEGSKSGQDIVYEATPVEPELPWWKQRRTKVFMAIICVLSAALLTGGLGVAFSRPIPIAEIDNNNNTATSSTLPSDGDVYLVVEHGGVKASYDNIEGAKIYLWENYLQGSPPGRMIVEVKHGTYITPDPLTIGCQDQGGGVDTGFNKMWLSGWDSIDHLNKVASTYLEDHNGVLKQPLPSPSLPSDGDEYLVVEHDGVIPSDGDVYLVVEHDGVKASYDNIEDAKIYLWENYLQGSPPDRMIVEVKHGTDITPGPHTIGCQNQGGGVDTGFNIKWGGWDAIDHMNKVASAYLEDHNGVLKQPLPSPSLPSDGDEYLVVEHDGVIPSDGDVYLVVEHDGVKASYDNVEDANIYLREHYPWGATSPDRMIVEVKKGKVTLDPHTINLGSNKWWGGWGSINRMNEVASTYLKDHSDQ